MVPHRFIRSGTIKRCGLVGEGVTLLGEVCFLLPVILRQMLGPGVRYCYVRSDHTFVWNNVDFGKEKQLDTLSGV